MSVKMGVPIAKRRPLGLTLGCWLTNLHTINRAGNSLVGRRRWTTVLLQVLSYLEWVYNILKILIKYKPAFHMHFTIGLIRLFISSRASVCYTLSPSTLCDVLHMLLPTRKFFICRKLCVNVLSCVLLGTQPLKSTWLWLILEGGWGWPHEVRSPSDKSQRCDSKGLFKVNWCYKRTITHTGSYTNTAFLRRALLINCF